MNFCMKVFWRSDFEEFKIYREKVPGGYRAVLVPIQIDWCCFFGHGTVKKMGALREAALFRGGFNNAKSSKY